MDETKKNLNEVLSERKGKLAEVLSTAEIGSASFDDAMKEMERIQTYEDRNTEMNNKIMNDLMRQKNDRDKNRNEKVKNVLEGVKIGVYAVVAFCMLDVERDGFIRSKVLSIMGKPFK